MARRTSIHGRALGFDKNNLYLNGRIVGNALTGRGKFIYVDSAVDGASGANPDEAVGTLDEAFALCTANVGDTIVVMPNHAETITGAGGIAHDVAGVSVIGLGTGDQHPRFLMDGAATVTYLISAADAYLENLEFASGHADVVTAIAISTGVGAQIINCEFNDNVANENFLSAIKSTGAANTADGLTAIGNFFYSADAATLGFVIMTDDSIGVRLEDNIVISEGTGLATMMTVATGKDVRGVRVLRNFLSSKATAGNLFISNDTASPNNSGFIAHNRCRHADVTSTHTLGVVGGCGVFDNLSASTDAVSGFVIPAIDTDA